jgi:hypothetical protein
MRRRKKRGKPPPRSKTEPDELETIEIRRLLGNPDGFPYAVLRGAQVMGWLREEADASRLVLSIQFIDLLKRELGRAVLDTVFWKLESIRRDTHARARAFKEQKVEVMR